MPLYDILLKDRNTLTYKKAGSYVSTTKKGALTEYFKYMYIGVIKNKDPYSIKRYEKIYGSIITRMNLNLDRLDFNKLFFHHHHIVVPANDLKPIILTDSEINNLAKAIKKPTATKKVVSKRVVAKKK